MDKIIKLGVSFVFLFGVFSQIIFGLTTISSCNFNLTTQGEVYELTQDITNTNGNCLEILNNDTVLDCKGFTITGDRDFNEYGILASDVNNITIQNCNVTEFWYGQVTLNNVYDSLITNFTNSYNLGIRIEHGDNNKVTNSNFNGGSGVFFRNAHHNIIENNNFRVETWSLGHTNTVNNNTFRNNKILEGSNPLLLASGACSSNIYNNTDSNNNEHYFFNTPNQVVDGWTNISTINICDAHGAEIRNLNIVGDDDNYFSFLDYSYVSNLTLENLNIRNTKTAMNIYGGNNNTLRDIYIDNASIGIYYDDGRYNLYENITINNSNLGMTSGYNERYGTHRNNIFLNSGTGLEMSEHRYNQYDNLEFRNNEFAVELGYSSYNNNYSNFRFYDNDNGFTFSADIDPTRLVNFTFTNSKNLDIEFPDYYSNDDFCTGTYLFNITGSSGNEILFINESTNLHDRELDYLMLCNADNSIINNVNISEPGIFKLDRSQNINISNLNISTQDKQIESLESSNVHIFNSTIPTKNRNGIYIESGSNFYFYNNYLGSAKGSRISIDSSNIYFNSSFLGQNVGNFWKDFTSCNTTENRGSYVVCVDPINYLVSESDNVYDNAPQFSNIYSPPIGGINYNIISPSISPMNISDTRIYFEVTSDSIISGCAVRSNNHWSLNNRAMANNDTHCWYTSSTLSNGNTYNYSIEIFGSNYEFNVSPIRSVTIDSGAQNQSTQDNTNNGGGSGSGSGNSGSVAVTALPSLGIVSGVSSILFVFLFLFS